MSASCPRCSLVFPLGQGSQGALTWLWGGALWLPSSTFCLLSPFHSALLISSVLYPLPGKSHRLQTFIPCYPLSLPPPKYSSDAYSLWCHPRKQLLSVPLLWATASHLASFLAGWRVTPTRAGYIVHTWRSQRP